MIYKCRFAVRTALGKAQCRAAIDLNNYAIIIYKSLGLTLFFFRLSLAVIRFFITYLPL
jgi:hypothetical protein